jgi:hypothetical protein
VTDQKLVTVARFEIPRAVYPSTNFVGGFFSIFLDPEITNGPSCGQFGTVDRRFRSSYTVGKIHYPSARRVSGGAGSLEVNYYFHVFQNGGCYELAFEFVEYDPSNADLGCRIPRLGQEDELNLAKPFIAQASFFRPTFRAPRKSNPQAVPRVTDFVASSQTADDVTNRGQITFSWSTQDTDYVEFSYRCVPAPNAPGVVILEPGGSRECENANPRLYPPESPNHSPHASQTVSFGNYHQLDPISIIVTITPFSHGMAYPHSSKSILVRVNPHNPFAEGVPAASGNIIITYSASPDGKGNYQQGSSLTIRWTDALSRDPCVNLYLIQDDGGDRASYRLQIGGTCFTPSSSGSYKWTIPDKYSGLGYRIFATTGTSSGIGPAFSIIRPRLHQPLLE